MDYKVDVKALKATFLVKEEVQNGRVFKERGIACAVRFKGSTPFLLTSSAAVEATDNRKKYIAQRFSRKHFGYYQLEVSILGQLDSFTFLRIMKEYPKPMGTAWFFILNLELPSSGRKALGLPLKGTGEFEIQVWWDRNSTEIELITTKSIDWTSILGIPIVIENKENKKRQSGRFSVIGSVGLTSEGKLCLCYLDPSSQNRLDKLLSQLKGAKGPTNIKELVGKETSTAQAQAVAASINLHEPGPGAILETEDQRSWREYGEAVANLLIMGFLTKAVHNYVLEAVVRLFIMAFEVLTQAVHNCVRFNSCSEETSTAQAQAVLAVLASINLHEQGPSVIVETEDQRSGRECGVTASSLEYKDKSRAEDEVSPRKVIRFMERIQRRRQLITHYYYLQICNLCNERGSHMDIDYAVGIFSTFYPNGYPRCETVKKGLKRLLCDRYRNDTKSFTDNFVHPTRCLLSKLQEQNFPLFLPNGDTNVHIVPPLDKLNIGEYFYQVGHTNPSLLVVKFAKYVNQGKSVKPLQPATVPNEDHDIAFTKEYFDKVRKEAGPLGDPLLRTIVVLRGPEWSIQRVGAINCLRNVYNIILFFAFGITITFTGSCCTKCMTYVCILTQIVSPALRLSN
ncbi:PREDICTED: uncharacterized protein LOC107332191 [Acropora digitifera]|uniref:uncharacterized protein LOC107332191 n=1 Tax=Acropora digitifera TaxID=70779 RepID=UPI00077B0B48|nr:PREDICTED: uncharacterized protein LOC107332191 [Acropora digitifera]